MTRSDYFYKKAKQIIQKDSGAPKEKVAAEIRETLFYFLDGLPNNLKHEIFQFYYEQWLDSGGEDLYILAEKPRLLVDLFHGDFQGMDLELSQEEWVLVREVVDAAADDMNLDLLTKLARLLTENHMYDPKPGTGNDEDDDEEDF